MRRRLALVLVFLALPLMATTKKTVKKGQTQPDLKRVAEIQKALVDHGYDPGTNWKETRESCRHIADDHGWQNMWAPDARVLFVLGLAPNLALNPDDMKPNSLDSDSRKWVEANGGEAARAKQ